MEYALINNVEYKRFGLDWYILRGNGLADYTELKTYQVMDMAFACENSIYW